MKLLSHPSISRLLLTCVFLLFIFSSSFSTDVASGSPIALISDWRAMSLSLSILSVIIISIVVMLATAFDISELKAWASSELTQVFSTALIVLLLSGSLTFMDMIVGQIVNGSNLGFTCSGTSICAVAVANNYLDGLIQIGVGTSSTALNDYALASKISSIRPTVFSQIFIYPVPLLQPQISFLPGAGYLLDLDRTIQVVETLSNILSSLYAQKFFVSEISFKLAPILLGLGVVARSFFFTRRIGGLLIAVGIGVMYVFPLMYVFDWLSLNVALSGGSSLGIDATTCPVQCMAQLPHFYIEENNLSFSSRAALYSYLDSSRAISSGANITIFHLDRGDQETATFGSFTVHSCNVNPCPTECRELPFPQSPSCFANASFCANLPVQCKLTRYADTSETAAADLVSCPLTCRSVPPLKSNCSVSTSLSTHSVFCSEAASNPAVAALCPVICASSPSDPICSSSTAMVPDDPLNCLDAKDYCRFARSDSLSVRPSNCRSDSPASYSCPASLDANQSCVWVLPPQSLLDSHRCDGCLFVKKESTLNPPIIGSCADLCGASGVVGPRKVSPSEFARRSSEGMVGKEDLKSIATLYLPGFLLPLLNIVITLMFIRSFSQFLGGDVDIPGLVRII
ncbi:hypothetical protein HY990_00840 [Candidatus Micrarchaeota archaeon]|nr:hypothetical protein [Candidatus Micrarchaeota archaeon]